MQDPATSRIPRLDGVSRLPKPSSFSLVNNSNSTIANSTATQHVRPPTGTSKATQIFRAPNDTPKARPASSYAPSSAVLRDFGSSLKKSASGERINNAVSLLSKRTTTALKKYFSPKPSSFPMTSSLPVTPLPAGKRGLVTSDHQMISSTPMPLLRSETFVCDEDMESIHPRLESTQVSTLGCPRMDLPIETQVLTKEDPKLKRFASTDTTPIMKPTHNSTLKAQSVHRKFSSLDTTHNNSRVSTNNATHTVHESGAMGVTRPVIETKDDSTSISGNFSGIGNVTKVLEGVGNVTKVLEGVGNLTKTFDGVLDGDPNRNMTTTVARSINRTKTFERDPNLTKTLAREEDVALKAKMVDPEPNLTKTFDKEGPFVTVDLIKTIHEPGNYTKIIHDGVNLTQSIDQLPLIEHMSIPSGLDILSLKSSRGEVNKMEQEINDTLDVTLTNLTPSASSRANMKLPLNSTLNTERLLDISGLQSPARHIQLLNLTQELERVTPAEGTCRLDEGPFPSTP